MKEGLDKEKRSRWRKIGSLLATWGWQFESKKRENGAANLKKKKSKPRDQRKKNKRKEKEKKKREKGRRKIAKNRI